MTAKKRSSKKAVPVVAFKGFDANLKCRDFQYEVGKTYRHDGEVVRCAAGGFHACDYPLDVFSYYEPATSRYAVVELSGDMDRSDSESDTKIAAATITVNVELKIPDLVLRAVEWIKAKIDTKIEQIVTANAATNTGYRSAATNTGNQSAATNTGDQSAATVDGMHSVAIATGYSSKAKACAGSAIVLVYRNDDYELVHIRAAIAGKDIKADTFYVLDADGEFQEVP